MLSSFAQPCSFSALANFSCVSFKFNSDVLIPKDQIMIPFFHSKVLNLWTRSCATMLQSKWTPSVELLYGTIQLLRILPKKNCKCAETLIRFAGELMHYGWKGKKKTFSYFSQLCYRLQELKYPEIAYPRSLRLISRTQFLVCIWGEDDTPSSTIMMCTKMCSDSKLVEACFE